VTGEPLTISALTLKDVPFEERVRVAAGAGFVGIGLRAEDYWAAQAAGLDEAGMTAILREHGISVTEVELLSDWSPEAERSPAQHQKEDTVLHVARAFGADHVNAAHFQRRPRDEVVSAFAALCDRAGEVRVALEFMPFGGLPDLASAWDVVHRAGRPNAGLLVDAWHWSRSRAQAADLDPVPAESLMAIQLSDVAERPMADARHETLHHRLAPGEGYGDPSGMVRALRGRGVRAMVSVEVMSDELLSLGPAAAAERVMAGARRVLAEAA
jgi:sugar phosphate isomerase/epimerase